MHKVSEFYEMKLNGFQSVKVFSFLGPIGTLVPIPFLPSSFRFFYIFLLPFIFQYLFRGISKITFQRIIAFLVFWIYCYCSAAVYFFSFEGQYVEGNPLIRVTLFLILFIFSVMAGDVLSRYGYFGILQTIVLFVSGYVVSLVFGYIFFIGYYAGIFSIPFLEHFHILLQFGYGLLRFSPGSYPNEYGIVSAVVLAIMCIFLIEKKHLRPIIKSYVLGRKMLVILTVLTLGALFLATTRAAYIGFIFSLIYIVFSIGNFVRSIKISLGILLLFVIVFLVAQNYYDIWGVVVSGYKGIFEKGSSSSTSIRLTDWNAAFTLFSNSPIFGTGFGSADMIHNTYLQLLFGLGGLGVFIFWAVFLLLFLSYSINANLKCQSENKKQLSPSEVISKSVVKRILIIFTINVLWFGFSNHNLNHFMTWFLVVILTAYIQCRKYSFINTYNPHVM